jgi:hypothetical protein
MRRAGSRSTDIFRLPRDYFFDAPPTPFGARRRERHKGRNVDFPEAARPRIGEQLVIHAYQAEHHGPSSKSEPTRRQTIERNRMVALVVIAAVAASAGLLQHFNDNLAPSGPATSGPGAYSAAR